jgi:hypothetical protein
VANSSDGVDLWLRQYFLQQQSSKESATATSTTTMSKSKEEEQPPFPFIVRQEINDGLCDKPSKPKDFSHTCYYNLSGLVVEQHYSSDDEDYFGDLIQTLLRKTYPSYNNRIDRVAKMLSMKWEGDEL